MTENSHDNGPVQRSIARRPHVYVFALAAVALAACAPSTGTTTAQPPTVTPVMSMSTATPPPPPPAMPVATVTVTAPPPVTVTAAPAPATIPVGHVFSDGPFQTPTGNIQCAMITYSTGGNSVRCQVTNHTWVAAQPYGCQLNWGDRVSLEQGSAAMFGCYGQEMQAPTHTLAYGDNQTLGSLNCDSEAAGVTCTDTNTGHYFFVSRDTVNLG